MQIAEELMAGKRIVKGEHTPTKSDVVDDEKAKAEQYADVVKLIGNDWKQLVKKME